MRARRHGAAVVLAVAALSLVAACRGGKVESAYLVAVGGDPVRGKHVMQQRDCGACHVIPGVRGARGLVGPPLMWFGRRTYIAGQLPNTPDNLVRWVIDPQGVEPGTAMPDLGLSEQEGRDVAAYLLSLR